MEPRCTSRGQPRASRGSAAGHRQPVRGGVEVHPHGVTVADLPGEEPAGELVPDRGLHQPPQRRPLLRIEPGQREPRPRGVRDVQFEPPRGELPGAGFRHVVRSGLRTNRGNELILQFGTDHDLGRRYRPQPRWTMSMPRSIKS